MSYLVLARKYRPQTFDEVIGQEVVTRVLAGALEEGRLGHAYLFAGPRGTGKTTIARILAKCLNCEEGPTAKPCGTCERCRAADAGSEVDVIELDAASHTGVDTIRELRDEVVYAPMRARTKVYIVDEVHMLSKGAFNALLKTLEEPPPHVVFLFATTEPHKVLDTILSRCQVLRLAPLSEEKIAERLEEVFRREGVEPGEGVVRELSRGARGGMRDALSLADKLLALAGNRPTLEDLQRLGGDVGSRLVEELLGQVEGGDRAGLLRTLSGVIGDEGELLAGLLDGLRTSVVLVHCGAEAPFVSATDEERATAVERGKRLGPARLELWMQELLRARERMRLTPGQEALVLEVTLLDLCRPEDTVPLADLVARVEALAAGAPAPAGGPPAPGTVSPSPRQVPVSPVSPVSPVAPVAPVEPERAPAKTPPRATPPKPASPPAPGGSPGGRLASLWTPFLSELGRSHGALAEVLGRLGAASGLQPRGDDSVVLALSELEAGEKKLVGDRRNRAACSRALSRVAGRALELVLEEGGGAEVPVPEARAPSGAASEHSGERPAERSKRASSAQDPFTREVADLFGGVIEEI